MSLNRKASALCCALVLALVWALPSAAKTVYHLEGNARYQIGGGLPLPITNAPVPNGNILAKIDATAQQTSGPDPKQLTIQPGMLTEPNTTQQVLGQFLNNPAVFEVQSNLGFSFPAAANGEAVFNVSGRGGAFPIDSRNPGGAFGGKLRYTATGARFGGAAHGGITGTAIIWARPASPPPCTFNATTQPGCVAAKIVANPHPLLAAGGAFGFTNTSMQVNQVPGVYVVAANTNGTIGFRFPTPNSNPGPNNQAASYGGPWTTGRITVEHTGADPDENFVLSGNDARVEGVGAISMVAASTSTRLFTKGNANRAFLNLVVGDYKVPTLPSWGFPLLAVLLVAGAFALLWMNRREVSSTS